MGVSKDRHPDYEEIARLERELGLAPTVAEPIWKPYPVPQPHADPPPPPPEAPRVPDDALYVCHFCGYRVRAGATACAHCGGQEWRRDDD